MSGNETGRIVKLAFTVKGTESELTVTLHNGTRVIQVQGSLIMPDGEPSASWFVTNILSPQLTSLAGKKNADITSYHSALSSMHSSKPTKIARRPSATAKSRKCDACPKTLHNNIPFPCSAGKCNLVLHKKCAPTNMHTCPTQQSLPQVQPNPPSPPLTLNQFISPPLSSLALGTSVTLFPAAKRPSCDISTIDIDEETTTENTSAPPQSDMATSPPQLSALSTPPQSDAELPLGHCPPGSTLLCFNTF